MHHADQSRDRIEKLQQQYASVSAEISPSADRDGGNEQQNKSEEFEPDIGRHKK